MSIQILKFCDKVPIEGNTGLDGAVQEFLTNPGNIKRLVSLIEIIYENYKPENEDGSIEEFHVFFKELFNYDNVEFTSYIQFFFTNEEKMNFPFSLTVRFTKYPNGCNKPEHYLYDVCFSNAKTVTVEKKEQYTLVQKKTGFELQYLTAVI